ncbi:nitroreductase family protein [Pelotomaculum terephthalicicum JT]|uniref:nitroreductase family protein n=1 Tax=Pelotomaculum TaxID=191373 RepID=UPI0009C7A1C1|nr:MULTISPECIES: nitroreductase family protein [Pelotomaculum]MCG9969426.1 nitroreductase family protein [Pelotomaculum terephthalicicum JT]OPX91523.1 MAG: FMN reductase (NAD(P)H) [Pelotomaculum sp. PtaB.Bin117]OPY63767.1 MAG: FMN reductase (NAD(P)H) [Pelotomaculum sp. PtaU1.Bin065]
MEYLDVIKKRYSVRSYKPDQVEQEKLHIILEAARLAPTAANRQAFKIIVADTNGRKEELKKIYNRDWFVEAPLILGVCAIPGENWVRSDKKNYSDVDAAIVMDHIILTATDLGLGTCWIGAFNLQAARHVLALDDTLEPIAFTPVGYARDTNIKKIRKSLDDLVVYK